MKSPLAKAKDKWILSDDGIKCCHGTATGQYLHNRVVMAFIAGADFSAERIEELEKRIKAAKEILRSQSFWCELADKECIGLRSIVHLVEKALEG